MILHVVRKDALHSYSLFAFPQDLAGPPLVKIRWVATSCTLIPHGRRGVKTGTTKGCVSGEIAGMPDIFIRSHAIIDYVTGALLILLPFAIPYHDQFDYFFEAAGAGLDATLFPVGEEIKSGRWTRIVQAARLAFQYQPQPFSITFDRPLCEVLPPSSQTRMSAGTLAGTTIRRKALLVVAANGPYYGGGFAVAAGACSKWELLRHFHSISQGRYRYSPKIETFSAGEIELASPNVIAMHIDGRPLGKTPVKLRARPGALLVFAPEHPVAEM